MSATITEHVRRIYDTLSRDMSVGVPEPLSCITRSWQRCVSEYSLDPARMRDPVILDRDKLRARNERLNDLVSLAQAEMVNLYQQLAGSGFAIFLADTDGVVLSFTGDPLFKDIGSRTAMIEGAIWDERHQGTNGIGTCIAEKRPVIVHKHDHFFARNIGLTCSGSPIFDPHGELIAVLDASSESHLAQQHTLALVNMSAQMLENRLFLSRFKDDYVLRFHSRPEFVHTLGEGLLGLSEDGKLLAANRSAVFQLALQPNDLSRSLEIRELFDLTVASMVDRGARDWYHPIPVYGARTGSRFFAILYQPRRTAPPAAVVPERQRSPHTSGGNIEYRFDALEFGDPIMAHNIARAKRLLNRDIPIMICGETGTGKEVFAKTLHYATTRADKPFVAVNCAAIPESLIESELFGYRPGAFTGASRDGKRGKILQANHGTLFLDEIGDMPLTLQSRLLRVLEEREVVSLGSETPVKVDFWLISATHRNLTELVAQGRFRDDLYYRLQGLLITLPPLRSRQDKRALIRHVMNLQNEDPAPVAIEEPALRAMEQFAWPGNLRQLRTVLRCMLATREGEVITLDDLPSDIRDNMAPALAHPPDMGRDDGLPAPRLNALETAMRESLLRELEHNRWNITSLAQQLKISRNTLYRKMKRLGIECKSPNLSDNA